MARYNTRTGSDVFYFYQRFSESQMERQRIQMAIRAYQYYKNDLVGIKTYLGNYLAEMINEATLSKMPLVVLNYIPKIVKRLTLAYNKAPISEIGESESKEQQLYAQWTRNLNRYRKEFHRQGKLFNTILVRPIPDEEKKQFKYLILNRGICEVQSDKADHLKPNQVSYQVPHPTKEDEDITLVWTKDEYYALDKSGKRIPSIEMSDGTVINGENPYGKIPFVILRFDESSDFWGDGMNDIVTANEHLNARLTDTFYKMFLSFGIPMGVNLGLKAQDFVLSPDTPIMVNNAKLDQQIPDLKFITPDQKIELDKVVSDWFINEMGVTKGLPAGAFAEKETAISGYSKMIDNLELIDLNEDDKEALAEFEYELFDMQKLVLEKELGIQLKGDLNFEFTPIEFPKSDQEIWFNREKEFQYNISSPLDWLREYRPQATNEELIQMLKETQLTNSEYKRTLSRLELLSGTTEQNNLRAG